ncbi:MAG: acyl-CoA dehydrogenase family protein [Pseudomonadota bacterium]
MAIHSSTALTLSEEQAMLMGVANEFCRDKSPIDVVREHLESSSGYPETVWEEMIALGWTGIALPESVGGSALGVGALVPVVEAMGRVMLATPLISSTLAGQLLQRLGQPSRVEGWLAGIAEGTIATVALLENGDWGSDRITTTLSNDGVLQGSKFMVPDVGVAELLLVPCLRDGETVIVVLRTEQVTSDAFASNVLIDETKRSANVALDGVQVAEDAVLEGDAVRAALRDVRLLGALLVAAEATGSAYSCLATVVEYLNTRKQFGKLIGSYQALKHPAVDILCGTDSARSLIYHAATVVGESSLDRDAEIACRMAKAHAAENLEYAGDRAVQFHGGMGFTYECDAQLYIRRAQWARQQFGDSQHHRKHLATLLLD